jgi:hypothetical protein
VNEMILCLKVKKKRKEKRQEQNNKKITMCISNV